MDTKSFLAGMAVGASAILGGTTTDDAISGSPRAAQTARPPPSIPIAPPPINGSDSATASAARVSQTDAQPRPAVPTPEVAAQPVREAPTTRLSNAERGKEAKDLAWSYNTEQALRQFLASHRLATQFDVLLVDCRTTFCEMEVLGSDMDAGPAWTQITHDLKKQPWYGFDGFGSSGFEHQGRPLFVTTLFRTSTASSQPNEPTP